MERTSKMNTKNIAIVVLAVIIVAAVSISVYYATRPETKDLAPTEADTLIFAEDFSSVTSFDPAETYGLFNAWVAQECYDTLITFEGLDNVVGGVAETWEISSDGKVWTFHLRDGVKFQSGNPVTAEDVVYSIIRVVEMKESPSFLFGQLGITNTSAVALNSNTVQVTLGQKWAKSIVEQALGFAIGGVVEKSVAMANEVDGDWGSGFVDVNTIGSGPYILKEFEQGSKVVLEWNPDHWRWSGESKVRELPTIKKIIGLCVSETQTLKMMAEKGEVDVVAGLDGQQLKDLEDQSVFEILQGPISGFRQVRMMILSEFRGEPNPLVDNRVREAIRWGIDYDGMIDAVWFGYATPLQTIVPHTQQGHLPLLPFSKDTAKAKALLAEAGFPEGLDLELIFRDTGDYRTFAEKLQSDLAESGINVELVVKGSADYRAQYRNRDWQLTIGGFGCDYEDPDAAITAFGPVNSVGPEEEVQLMGYYCGWVNSTIRSWIDEARTTVEWEDRAPLYEKIQREILYNSPIAMIAEKPFRIYVARNWIHGLVPHTKWHFRAEDIVKEGQ